MKEIMVIKDEQAIDEWNRTIAQFIDVDNKIYKAEFIKVPENWEELKELCEELESKNVFIINAGNCIEFNGLYFWKDGSITNEGSQRHCGELFPEIDCAWRTALDLLGASPHAGSQRHAALHRRQDKTRRRCLLSAP